MSMFESQDGKREIIIVKRDRDNEDEHHHGGVWKIAFADFMTAMMCFFLVMWLVSASSEQTKAAMASYFNPMKLVDTTPSRKGLDEPGETSSWRVRPLTVDRSSKDQQEGTTNRDGAGSRWTATSRSEEDTARTSDQHLFSDPYAVLAEIAAQTATLQNVSEKGDGGAQDSGPATGAQGGQSYRDPFAPDFWSQEVAAVEHAGEFDIFGQGEDAESQEQAAKKLSELASGAKPAHDIDPNDGQTEEKPAIDQETKQVAEQLRADIAKAFGNDSELNKAISITEESGGVLISVTEEFNFGMFEVGSAVPRGELVLAMEKIGRLLNEHSGRIRVNGHTDGRPFRNDNYDNWRLSAARAHSAYYMLVRSGIDEMRFKEVAGFADRQLKLADDPYAAVNRRIEIFLETEG